MCSLTHNASAAIKHDGKHLLEAEYTAHISIVLAVVILYTCTGINIIVYNARTGICLHMYTYLLHSTQPSIIGVCVCEGHPCPMWDIVLQTQLIFEENGLNIVALPLRVSGSALPLRCSIFT